MIIRRFPKCFMVLGYMLLLLKCISAREERADLSALSAEFSGEVACGNDGRLVGLLRSETVDDQDTEGQYKHHEDVRDNIAQCASIERRTSDGYCLIHFAAAQKTSFALRLLIEKGACLDVRDGYGSTPLHIAIARRRFENANVLLEAGVDPSVSNGKCGKSPLHYATNVGQYASADHAQRYEQLCFALLEKGALPAVQDSRRVTPLHLAIRSGFFSFVDYCVNQLGMDINAIDAAGRGPIIYASECSKPEMLEFVMELGANPKLLLKSDVTQMHIAAREGLVSAITFLAAQGISVNGQDKTGCTPLHYAADKGHLHTVKVLLNHGARPDVRDFKKRVPDYYAKKHRHQEVEQCLKRARAPLAKRLVAARRQAVPAMPLGHRGSALVGGKQGTDVALQKFARDIGASVIYA